MPLEPDPAWVDVAARQPARGAARAPPPTAASRGASATATCSRSSTPARSTLIEETVAAGASPEGARKWWLGELARRANEQAVELSALGATPAHVAELQALVEAGTLNDKLARTVLEGVIAGEGTPAEVVAARGLAVVSDTGALTRAVDDAIEANPAIADEDP